MTEKYRQPRDTVTDHRPGLSFGANLRVRLSSICIESSNDMMKSPIQPSATTQGHAENHVQCSWPTGRLAGQAMNTSDSKGSRDHLLLFV